MIYPKIKPGRHSKAAKLTRKIARRIGAGEDPFTAAAEEFLLPAELIALRIRYHPHYDTGLLEGRGVAIPKRKHRASVRS